MKSSASSVTKKKGEESVRGILESKRGKDVNVIARSVIERATGGEVEKKKAAIKRKMK